MVESETVLLERFSARADAEAFAELVRRHVRLVYSTSWRVLKDDGHAADVTQETFFELTRQAGQISGSLGSWLHRVATRKSIDLIRRSTHRRRREQTYAETQPEAVRTWHDLSGYVDEAVEDLDESVKSVLLEHFLAGKTTAEIAREQGISQATVSRRINDGLEQLRGALRRQGLLVGAASLGTMLLENTSQAVPVTVLAELSKISMVGTTAAAGHGWMAAVAANADLAKILVATAAVAGVITVAGYMQYSKSSPPAQQPPTPAQRISQVSSPGTRAQAPRLAAVPPSPSPVDDGKTETSDPQVPAKVNPPVAQTLRPLVDDAAGMGGIGLVMPAPPAVIVARRVAETGVADLSTPETAVYSMVAFVEQGKSDQLDQCLAEGAEEFAGFPPLGYLGSPVQTIDATYEDDSAEVTWRATVRTPFPLEGNTWLPGDAMTLTAKAVQVDRFWKVCSISPQVLEESP